MRCVPCGHCLQEAVEPSPAAGASPDGDAVLCGDSRAVLVGLPDGLADLCVTDPPFNVGLEYDAHDDALPLADYLDLLRAVFRQVHRVLKPAGSLYVAICHEREPDVAILLRELGFH